MMDVGQSLKNNILFLTIIAIMAAGCSVVAGMSFKSEIYSLGIPIGIIAIIFLAIGLYIWDNIVGQINVLKENKSYVQKDCDKVE